MKVKELYYKPYSKNKNIFIYNQWSRLNVIIKKCTDRKGRKKEQKQREQIENK